MKYLSLVLLFVSLSAQALGPNEFKAARVAAQFQCGEKLKDYSLEKEFSSLFSYSYLNRDVSAIKKMNIDVVEQMQKNCKSNGYPDFNVQICFETCWKHYPKNDLLREQCHGACSSLRNKLSSLQADVAGILNADLLSTQKCRSSVKVNDSGREFVKEKSSDSKAPAVGTGSTKQ